MSGRVQLDCVIQIDTTAVCTVESESPQGYGFGEAALRLSQTFRIRPATRDGVPIEGGHVHVPVRFDVRPRGSALN